MATNPKQAEHLAKRKKALLMFLVPFLGTIFTILGWSFYKEAAAVSELGDYARGIESIVLLDEKGGHINTIKDPALIEAFEAALQSAFTQHVLKTSDEPEPLKIRGARPELDYDLGRSGEKLIISVTGENKMELTRCRLHGDYPNQIHCSFELPSGTTGQLSAIQLRSWLASLPPPSKGTPLKSEK